MTKQTVSNLLALLVIIAFVMSFGYMLVENTRLSFENTRIKAELAETRNDLVDSQNTAYGYKWKLEQSGFDPSDYGGSEDE